MATRFKILMEVSKDYRWAIRARQRWQPLFHWPMESKVERGNTYNLYAISRCTRWYEWTLIKEDMTLESARKLARLIDKEQPEAWAEA